MNLWGNEIMNTTIYVYTRKVEKDSYPEGLAESVHFAVAEEGKEQCPWNKNYGMLFAKAEIADDNTIVPMGVRNPVIFKMDDGMIGVAAERIHEDGSLDETAEGKLLLWTTGDLVHFTEEVFVEKEEIEKYDPKDSLTVDNSLVEEAANFWNPIKFSHVEVPEKIEAGKLGDVQAEVYYSDGSVRKKNVKWDLSGVDLSVPGEYQISGCIEQQSYKFPLSKGYGDPVIFPWEGKWYFISTNDNLHDIGIYVREADDVAGLFAEDVVMHLILPFDPERKLEQTFWAPEFHVIGGELYILFAVSGHEWGPQCHLMKKKKGANIIEEDSWEDPIPVVKQDGSPLAGKGAITLDMTYFKTSKASYVSWSYREKMGTPQDTGSMVVIATIDENEPWRLTSEPVVLTRPLYGWENVSGTINNEGPNAFQRDGKVYVAYSGGAANGYTYTLGLLTADEDADLLDVESWTKAKAPILDFYSVEGEYGSGHNSFFVNDDGELMFSYHAETTMSDHLRCDGIRRVHFRKDGSPYFKMAIEDDVVKEEVKTTVAF